MKFIAVDLELNQPSNKIIQIGAAAFCTDQGLTSTFNAYVDPEEDINWDYRLGGVEISLVELLPSYFPGQWFQHKLPLTDALSNFEQWRRDNQCGKKIVQWGSGDLYLLRKADTTNILPRHFRDLDAKLVYQFLWQPASRLPKRSGLSRACRGMGVSPPEYPHDAMYDAQATGDLFLKMYRQVEGLHQLLDKLQ